MLAAAAVLAIAAGVVGWSWWRGRVGFAVGLVPVDRDRAVLLVRRNDDDATHFWAVGVGPDGIEWRTELDGEPLTLSGRHGASVDGQTLTLFLARERALEPLMLSLADGSEVRRGSRLSTTGPSADSNFEASTFADGRDLFQRYHDGERTRLSAFDRESLQPRWSIALRDMLAEPLLAERTVGLVDEEGPAAYSMAILDRSSGREIARVPMNGRAACWSEAGPMFLREGAIRSFDVATARESVVGPWTDRWPIACGTRRGRVVLTINDSERGLRIVVASTQGLRELGRIELPGRGLALTGLDTGHEQGRYAMFAGELPRYLAVISRGAEWSHLRLSVLDLDEYTVAWQSQRIDELLHFGAHRVGDMMYVWSSTRDRLIAIDGRTGSITGAIQMRYLAFRPSYVADGRVWVYTGSESVQPSELSVSVLDARTLRVIRSRGAIQPTEALDDARSWLGVAP